MFREASVCDCWSSWELFHCLKKSFLGVRAGIHAHFQFQQLRSPSNFKDFSHLPVKLEVPGYIFFLYFLPLKKQMPFLPVLLLSMNQIDYSILYIFSLLFPFTQIYLRKEEHYAKSTVMIESSEVNTMISIYPLVS